MCDVKDGENMNVKIGRPKAENPKTIRYSIRFDQQMESKLKLYCEQHNITKGEAIRRGLETLLSAK